MMMHHCVAGSSFIVGSMLAMGRFGMHARVGQSHFGTVGQSVMRRCRRFNDAKCQSNRQPTKKNQARHYFRTSSKELIKQSERRDVTK